MRDRDKDIGVSATDPDRIELEDSGDSLQAALAEEERSAIAAAEEKLQSVMGDLDELKDRHRRKLAEFENMRKRTEREKGEYLRVALGKFIGDFLTISDDFDRALAHATPEEKATDFGQGVGLIQRKLAELWKKYGLEEIDTSGSFDPNVHEAVATEPSKDLPKDTILEVMRKGYKLNDKLIRPALVKVTVPEKAEG
ncbi:MAG TPA: nucleotide exchange factor GrpE [Thermoanaerobaculia bacterium]|jgi:molecular chaperone GrpE|nr:nucleotide exchange factor GrpE [Thermoanaerobaculia bacterium]